MSINWNNKSNLIVCYSHNQNGKYIEYPVLDIYDDGDDAGGRYDVTFNETSLWFYENGDCNIGREVAYIKQKEGLFSLPADQLEVVVRKGTGWDGVYPVNSISAGPHSSTAYIKFTMTNGDETTDMALFFTPEGPWNVGTNEYIIRRKTVEPSKVGIIDWDKPLETEDGRAARKAPYDHLTDGRDRHGNYHVLVGSGKREKIYFYKEDGTSCDLDNRTAPKLRNKGAVKVDFAKPIWYVDGSPANYLGARGNGVYAVTPRGQLYATTGNHYNEEGKHVYNHYMDIENVPDGATNASFKIGLLVGEAARNKKGLEANLRKWVNEGKITVN